MTAFDAVCLDLFDTLVLFERDRLPEVQLDGRTLRSTVGTLHQTLRAYRPEIALEPFAEALFWSWQEAERIRDSTTREVSAQERFAMLFGRLGVEPRTLPPAAIPALLSAHMGGLAQAMLFPPHHRLLLQALRARHRLALVSNFDYTPTVEMVLGREGVAGCFDAVIVSADIGWRKPGPRIFDEALRRLGVPPARALFVGDRLDVDVAGAQAAGMRAAWLNREGAARPADQPVPDFEIRDLDELRAVTGIAETPPGISRKEPRRLEGQGDGEPGG